MFSFVNSTTHENMYTFVCVWKFVSLYIYVHVGQRVPFMPLFVERPGLQPAVSLFSHIFLQTPWAKCQESLMQSTPECLVKICTSFCLACRSGPRLGCCTWYFLVSSSIESVCLLVFSLSPSRVSSWLQGDSASGVDESTRHQVVKRLRAVHAGMEAADLIIVCVRTPVVL